MVSSLAAGSLTVGNVKWVWWFFAICWLLYIIFSLGKQWAESAKSKGGQSSSVYSKLAGIVVITWFLYPIVWVFAEGFGNFSVTFEVSASPLLLFGRSMEDRSGGGCVVEGGVWAGLCTPICIRHVASRPGVQMRFEVRGSGHL